MGLNGTDGCEREEGTDGPSHLLEQERRRTGSSPPFRLPRVSGGNIQDRVVPLRPGPPGALTPPPPGDPPPREVPT